jgi:hypothetical protein
MNADSIVNLAIHFFVPQPLIHVITPSDDTGGHQEIVMLGTSSMRIACFLGMTLFLMVIPSESHWILL